MADIKFYTRAIPTGFKSPALSAALRNLGRIPEQLGKIGAAITAEIKRNLSGRILNKRSGKLYDSWEWEVTAANAGWRLIIGSDVAYARIHNFGGWTGKNHRTHIRKSRYVDRAVIAKKNQVRRILQDFVANITRG